MLLYVPRNRRLIRYESPGRPRIMNGDELMLNVLRCHLTYEGQVVTNAEARFNKSHIRKVYACLAVTCHLHFWQNDRDFLRATVVAHTDTEIRVSTESRPWRRKFSRRSSRDSNPRPFNHESGALTTELSPPPRIMNVVDRFYTALFSALEQTHCARMGFCTSDIL